MEIINVITNLKNVFFRTRNYFYIPKVCIPADFESSMESSGSDNEGDFIFKVPTTPTDLTSATSTPTELGTTLSQVALSSQTSEESDNTAPATPGHTKKRG